MTKKTLTSYLQKDLKRIDKERASIKPSRLNTDLRKYLTIRKSILKEILNLIN